jgi:hypothetical protein
MANCAASACHHQQRCCCLTAAGQLPWESLTVNPILQEQQHADRCLVFGSTEEARGTPCA